MFSKAGRVAVGSLNPVKVNAVRSAFEKCFPGIELQLLPASVDSGVGDQPMSDEETRQGARNRVRRLQLLYPDADFWVGLEGGVETYDGQLLAFAWMAVGSASGVVSETRSVTLPLPPEVQSLVAGGLELGDANDRVFATVNSKQGGGAFGLLTGGLHTRESVYEQTLVMALIPFVNELWHQPGAV